MFYNNSGVAFKLIGIFYVERKSRFSRDLNRSHTAISYRLSGNSVFTIGNEKITATAGSVVYIPAGVDFCRKSETDERLIIIHLEAHGDLTKTIEVEENCQFLESDFKLLAEIWRSGDASAYNRCMAMLYGILCRLEESKRGEKEQIIERGVSLLQRSFRDPDLTVKDLAHECSVSEVYFRRIFRMQYGISPHRMILNLRFEYSKSLLASGYYSVKEVAKMSGFSDIKHFRSSFKSEFGLTPNAFAKEAGRSSNSK